MVSDYVNYTKHGGERIQTAAERVDAFTDNDMQRILQTQNKGISNRISFFFLT